MNMVGHKHPCVHLDRELLSIHFKPMLIDGKILITSKTDLPIIATLNDVLRHCCRANSKKASHGSSLNPSEWVLIETRIQPRSASLPKLLMQPCDRSLTASEF